jgi:hypothetical protein
MSYVQTFTKEHHFKITQTNKNSYTVYVARGLNRVAGLGTRMKKFSFAIGLGVS